MKKLHHRVEEATQLSCNTAKKQAFSFSLRRQLPSRETDQGKWRKDKTALKPSENTRPRFLDGKRLFQSQPLRCRGNTVKPSRPQPPESIKRKRAGGRLTVDSGFASPLRSSSQDQNDAFWILDNVFNTPTSKELLPTPKRPRKSSFLQLPEEPTFGPLTPRRKNYPDDFCRSFVNGEKRQLLGKGSFGCVYMGEIRGVKVAAKLCPNNDCDCCGERNGLDLKHPNIVTTHRILPLDVIATRTLLSRPEISDLLSIRKDYFLSRGMMIVMMEYAGDHTLQRLIDYPNENFQQNNFFSILSQIASALSYMHSLQIIHLDLKPKNIMVSYSFTCKLVDFGCSKRIDKSEVAHREERKSEAIGTIAYTAPEIFAGHRPTEMCDIYAFAIIMWQLTTREDPYGNKSAHSIIFQVVSQGLRPLFPDSAVLMRPKAVELAQRCWSGSPKARPTSAQLVQELEKLSRMPFTN